MPQYYRLKRSFTAGELSELMYAQVDNDRFRNGLRTLVNAYVKPQGPVYRRSGTRFIDDVGARIGGQVRDYEKPKLVPFVVSETVSYMLCFYPHSSGTVRVTFMQNDGLVADNTAIRVTSSGDTRVTSKGEVRVAAGQGDGLLPFIYEIPGTFVIADIYYAQSKDILYITQPSRSPLEFKRVQPDVWTLQEASFIDRPEDWGGVTGWPSLVAFYEQRIAYAATKARPQTLWFSKAGDFSSFAKSSPIIASDSFSITLDSGQQNGIAWLSPARRLLTGTIGDEWSVGGAGTAAASFETIRATRQTNEGGSSLRPIQIGAVVLFMDVHKRTVHQYSFNLNDDSYTTDDLSILAPHLTLNNTFTNWAHQKEPNGIVWCIRDDGVVCGLTFQRKHNIIGWHRHTTEGKFIDVACKPGNQEDEVWFLTEREINGSTKWYVERMSKEFTSDTTEDAYFLDCYAVYEGDPATVIQNLGHLEGETVGVLGDGAVMGDETVSGSEITIGESTSKVVVGLKYKTQVSPTVLDINMQDGTLKGRVQKSTHVSLEFYKTVGGKYTTSVGTYELPFRTPLQPTGVRVPLFNGTKEIALPSNWERGSEFTIEQDQPLPMCVVSMVDRLQVYEEAM